MNKSIEYIKNRIVNTPDSVNNMPIDGWDDSIVMNPLEMYKHYIPELKDINKGFHIHSDLTLLNGKRGQLEINIEYDPNSDFDYFTMETSTHDGTLLFTQQCLAKLLDKLLNLKTYAKNKITEDMIENLFDYKIKYIIGDILLHRDFGIKNINGNKWAGQTDIVVLPIKMIVDEVNK